MILDGRQISAGSTRDYDVCIVGAGPAGITAAKILGDAGAKVALLEAGGEWYSRREQEKLTGEVSDSRAEPALDRHRIRRFGGTSTVWGGRCAPFDEEDFAGRPHAGLRSWPISFSVMRPHYEAAHSFLDLGGYEYDTSIALSPDSRELFPGMRWQDVDATNLWRFSLPTDFRKKYRAEIRRSANVHLYLNAPCLELIPGPDPGDILAAEFPSPHGDAARISARAFVIAAGALETARLLLLSKSRHPNGVGNNHDQVGRYYMTHLYGTLATLRYLGDPRLVRHGFETSVDGVYVRHMLRIGKAAEIKHGLMHFNAILAPPSFEDPSHKSGILSAMYFAKWALARRIPIELIDKTHQEAALDGLRHLGNVVGDSPATLKFAIDWLRRRSFSTRKLPGVALYSATGKYQLLYSAEQSPNPESRVVLSTLRDVYGKPKLRSEWRCTEKDVDTIERSLQILSDDVRNSSSNKLEFSLNGKNLRQRIRENASVGSHQIGTARMSANEKSGVVDASCRVHGISNLFIASSAVFPTSGSVSPTLSIVATASYVAQQALARLNV
ncbi:GMC family oxidoreductase [Bradyrhizobium manausense]|uniref:GMC oxidoreductase n=1 Tax=Bradyrhizobium manausense TaxID=989370 RepID=UPI001BAAE53C|nr:GMC family oxidoreductase [Bradyrhizobium manausense]MBR0829859.1 GMC family oxidoreductase [Bradyrhizobium manausense]